MRQWLEYATVVNYNNKKKNKKVDFLFFSVLASPIFKVYHIMHLKEQEEDKVIVLVIMLRTRKKRRVGFFFPLVL